MSKSNGPPLHTHSELRYKSSNTFVCWIKGNTGEYGITANGRTKKIKRTEHEFKNTKARFPILTLPFQETYFTQTSKRKRAKPHHARPYLCEAHLDKIKSTQNKKHVSFHFHTHKIKKKRKREEKKDRLMWDSLKIIQTIFYTHTKKRKPVLKQEYLFLMSEHFIYIHTHFNFLSNTMLF